jgi:hypothetical protein
MGRRTAGLTGIATVAMVGPGRPWLVAAMVDGIEEADH